MMPRIALALLTLAWAAPVFGCSAKAWDENELVSNEPVFSANGRFAVVVRWHENVTDFTSRRAGDTLDPFRELDPETPPAPRPIIAALYRMPGHRLIAELPVDVTLATDVLVADSGSWFVTVHRRACGGWAADDRLVTVYRADGSGAGWLNVGDVFNEYDVFELGNGRAGVDFALRNESDRHEVLVITAGATERRVDLATVKLLGEKTDVFQRPRIEASAVTPDAPRRELAPAPADCAAAFDDPSVVHLGSEEFFAHVADSPFPEYPIIALKTRIRGSVRLQVVVSENGSVLCTRHSRLPFGLDAIASDTVKRWQFAKYVVDGRRRRFAGEILVHFR